jgi:hypothetical protein
MTTENNWLTHNLRERLTNPNTDFNHTIKVDMFDDITFDEASTEVCYKLQAINPNIFLGLSGGLDSEYVFRKLHSLEIPFTSVIVQCPCYTKETQIAFNLCKEYGVEPVVIEISEKEMFLYYHKNIYESFNGIGIGSVASITATEYAKNHNGIFIKSEHTIGDIDGKVAIEMNEFDFYCNINYDNSYNFFMYTPEIVYSLAKCMGNTDSQTFKCAMFNIPYREKIYPNYSPHIMVCYKYAISKRKYRPSSKYTEIPKKFIEDHFKK